VHPDVRRVLLTIRAFNEAARAMVVWTALKSDVAHRSSRSKGSPGGRRPYGLMTPVLKGYLTDLGFANAVQGSTGLWRSRPTSPNRAWSIRPRCPHRHDL